MWESEDKVPNWVVCYVFVQDTAGVVASARGLGAAMGGATSEKMARSASVTRIRPARVNSARNNFWSMHNCRAGYRKTWARRCCREW